MTAMRAGGPSSGVLARITASSAACSTATHTDVSALHTSVTSSMPSRSAEAIRASSRRRSVRAAAMARTGSACRPADATRARATAVGFDVEQLRSVGPVGVELDDLGCPHQQFGHVRRRAEHPHQPLGHRALVAQRRQVPPLLGERLADAPVGQQPGIRIRRVGEPVQQRRQQHLLHSAAPAAGTWSAPPGGSARSAGPRNPARPADVRRRRRSCLRKVPKPAGSPTDSSSGW